MTPPTISMSGIFLLILQGTAHAYSIGDVDSRALQGVWRLTSLDNDGLPFERNKQLGRGFFPPPSSTDPKTMWKIRVPMKEFTTYPKKKKSEVADGGIPAPTTKQTEIFIRIKDDYTFEQCTSFSDGTDEETSLEDQLETELSKRERESFALTGTWDFLDGKLILAEDRPKKKSFSVYDIARDNKGVDSDTILVGKVAVQSEESLTENPALGKQEQDISDADDPATSASLQQPKKTFDVHLSVPKGKIKTGKFMYPQAHPSFFEQPIIRPRENGRFELKQVLGEYNAKLAKDDELTELYRKKDLVGKRFYLSTFPIPKRRKKFEAWDKKEMKFVQREYEQTEAEKKQEELEFGNNMQVVAVELFANNTFSTLAGLGSSTVLRGKWSIIGKQRGEFYMSVSRFGFGRSISGSTFSEGTSLTQDDEKGYWGDISGSNEEDNNESQQSEPDVNKIEIKGSVMFGYVAPEPIGRFKMIEIEDILEEEEDDAEEEDAEHEYEEMSDHDMMENANSLDSIMATDADDSNLKGSADDDFDTSGAFE